MEDPCIIPVMVAIILGVGTIMGMGPIFQVTAITMDTARMYQAMATTTGKVDLLLDTDIITVTVVTIRGMVTITDTERFIDRNSGIMGEYSWFFFLLRVNEGRGN
ncbi:hypothetical protein AB986_08185 [Alkalihalobacillus macyae]|uniref:Uncharacterized protein n=1 Tax=Guptibacillus hwajinpoensis TaxID=208199 RepID=A0A0J6FXX6_9BACL|nr:hypothetical protein AB986_08185 [Alkalihalobacillus macyae]